MNTILEKLKELKDGVYAVTYDGLSGTYMSEKIEGEWYGSDGTGWREKMGQSELESITSVVERKFTTEIKKDFVFENTYPLSDFFK